MGISRESTQSLMIKYVGLSPFQNHKIMALKPLSSKSFVLLVAIILFLAQSTVAQNSQSISGGESSWKIGFSVGVSKFLTSINPNSDAVFKKFNYWNTDYNAAITLSVIKKFSPKFSGEFEFQTTKLSGNWNENNGYPVPLRAIDLGLLYPTPFKTGVNQFNLMLVANLNQIVAPNRASDKWYLFVKGGGGAAFLKEYSALFPYSIPGNKFEYTIVYGGGLSYQIDEKIKLNLGVTWYRVETDRLDGVHTLKPGVVKETSNADFFFNIKERYIYPYIGMTYALGQRTISKAESKANVIQKNRSRTPWVKPTKRKFKPKR